MERHAPDCPYPGCFFCVMKETNPTKRRSNVAKFFKELPSQNEDGQVLAISGLWNTAMAHPNDPEFIELGIFECMAQLIWKGIEDRHWLAQDQNIYIPYYAAHIIGSYTMNVEEFAGQAVRAGVIPALVELLRGRLTWVEQRVAVRALGHLATYDSTFPAVAAHRDILELSIQLAIDALEIVYTHFLQFVDKRMSYHCDLLTRGMGGLEMESRKAEEWASQLQCWSLQLINCFAFKEEFLPTICQTDFLGQLPSMWGGLVNENSPAGVGVLRTICHQKLGRIPVAECSGIIEALCTIARSSDDWQYMAVDCLVWLLQDPNTRLKVLDKAAVALVDLAELPSLGEHKRLGEVLTNVLLEDYIPHPTPTVIAHLSTKTRHLLDEFVNSERGRSMTGSLASLLPGSRCDHQHEEGQEQGDEFMDPLGASSLTSSPSLQPPFFPFAISKAASRFEAHQHRHSSSISSGPGSDALALAITSDWNSYKASVMHRFASTGTITVTTGLDILSKEPKGHKKSVTAAHLEQLEDSDKEAREEFKIVSQQEYVMRLRELNDEIALAWLNNERVSALRLTIKVARLLMDTSVPHFYPTLFILVTDVMDTVGNLVWNRIKKKAEEDEFDNVVAPLPVNFTADDVRSEAKETCNNWFYKISCIRELLPRIYLEIAILRCTIFLEKGPPVAAFQRLTMMMRGLSDPLASAYAHLYLARRGQLLLPPDAGSYIPKDSSGLSSVSQLSVSTSIPESRGYLINGLHDYLILFRRVIHGEFDKNITSCGVDRRMYAMLVEPAFEWIVQCLFKNANEDELALVVHTFGDAQPITSRQRAASGSQGVLEPVSVIMYCMLKQLPATYIAREALNILKMMKSSNDISLSQHLNYKLFGMKLCDCSPPRQDRITILNDAWQVVMTYSCLAEYMEVAEVYVDYILQSCTEVELNILLKDIWKHLSNGDVLEAVLISLESIVFKLVSHYNDLTKVLNLVHVVEILDFFVGDIRLSVYKQILTSVTRTNQKIIDPVTRHIVLEQGRVLHDSLDSLSSDDERRQITRLIARLVQLVDYGLDLEQNLEFLVECRATFGNMDLIRVTVVHISNRLAITALQFAKVSPSKQTKDFVKACLTFNGITIPSITNIIQRMHLFLETAEAALMNGLLSHTEGLVKSALMCLQDNSNGDGLKVKEYEEAVSSFLQKLVSFLVVMPGHPELGAFYILRGILGLLDSKHGLASGRRKVRVLCGIICMLAAVGQVKGLQPVIGDHVDSNDVLYYEDPLYQEELADITANVLDMVVMSLDQASDKVQVGYQYLDACNALVTAFKVNVDLRTRCSEFLRKASAALPVTDNYLQVTLDFAQRKGDVIIS